VNKPKTENKSAPPKYSPVMQLAASRFGNNRWIVFSVRLLRLVMLYSDLEYDHWVTVEANHRIISYCEQPLRIRAKTADGFVTTVFDMWLLFASGREVFREVKYNAQLTEARVVRQLLAQRTYCAIESGNHEVFDEHRIRRNPVYLHSWKFMLHVLAATHKTNLVPICERVSHLLRNGRMTLQELEANCSSAERSLLRPAVFKMLHAGQAKAPLGSQEITNHLPVELRQ
jgi:hypothetical protein